MYGWIGKCWWKEFCVCVHAEIRGTNRWERCCDDTAPCMTQNREDEGSRGLTIILHCSVLSWWGLICQGRIQYPKRRANHLGSRSLCGNKSFSGSGSQGLNSQLSLENTQQIWYRVIAHWRMTENSTEFDKNIYEFVNILIQCSQLFLQVKNYCLEHRI